MPGSTEGTLCPPKAKSKTSRKNSPSAAKRSTANSRAAARAAFNHAAASGQLAPPVSPATRLTGYTPTKAK